MKFKFLDRQSELDLFNHLWSSQNAEFLILCQTFTVYVRDRLPDDQDPQVVNDIFNTNSGELAARCNDLARPKWLTKETKTIKVSLESFPYKVS